MNQTQTAYAEAKAIYLTLKEQRDALTKAWQDKHGKLERGSDERHVEGYYEYQGQVETALGYWPAIEKLATAENDMIDWAIGKVIHLANTTDAARIADMAKKAKTFEMTPKNRQALIDLSFRLSSR